MEQSSAYRLLCRAVFRILHWLLIAEPCFRGGVGDPGPNQAVQRLRACLDIARGDQALDYPVTVNGRRAQICFSTPDIHSCRAQYKQQSSQKYDSSSHCE